MKKVKTKIIALILATTALSAPAIAHASDEQSDDMQIISLTTYHEIERTSLGDQMSVASKRVIRKESYEPIEPIAVTYERDERPVIEVESVFDANLKIGSLSSYQEQQQLLQERRARGLYPKTRYVQPLEASTGFSLIKKF